MPTTKKPQRGLGRGLGALLGDAGTAADESIKEQIKDIPIKLIDTDPNQPRKDFKAEEIAELAQSIKAVGLIQPIIVQPNDGRYTIIAGERRYRACRVAEMNEVKCIVRDMEYQKRIEATLIENLQRSDLNPVEEAMGLKRLMDESGVTQEEAASRIGRSRSALANSLRLLTLPDSILKLLRDGKLSAGHGRALVTVAPELQEKYAAMCVTQGLSVRQLEALCAPKERVRPPKAKRDPQIKQMEEMLTGAFGLKAKLDGDVNKGRIVINYSSGDELQRVWEITEQLLNK